MYAVGFYRCRQRAENITTTLVEQPDRQLTYAIGRRDYAMRNFNVRHLAKSLSVLRQESLMNAGTKSFVCFATGNWNRRLEQATVEEAQSHAKECSEQGAKQLVRNE